MPTAPRPGTRPIYVELPQDLADHLEAIALANRRTLKAEITLAVERHVELESAGKSGGVERAVHDSRQKSGGLNRLKEKNTMPTTRGRYLLHLGEPILRNGSRWVHFSWRGESFCLRDFVAGGILRQDKKVNAIDVWHAAKDSIPATGKYFHPVGDWEWWRATLEKLSQRKVLR